MASNNQSNPSDSANVSIPPPNISDDQPNDNNEPGISHQTIDEWANIAFLPSSIPTNDPAQSDDIATPSSSMSRDDLPSDINQAGTDEGVTVTDNEPINPNSSSPERPNYDDGQCAICLGPHLDRSRPNCGHVFCFDCLKEWCRVKLECPTCRQPFTNFVHMITGTATDEVSQVYTPDAPPVPTQSRRTIIIQLPYEWRPLLNDPQFQRFLMAMFMQPVLIGDQAEHPTQPPPNPSSDDQSNNSN